MCFLLTGPKNGNIHAAYRAGEALCCKHAELAGSLMCMLVGGHSCSDMISCGNLPHVGLAAPIGFSRDSRRGHMPFAWILGDTRRR